MFRTVSVKLSNLSLMRLMCEQNLPIIILFLLLAAKSINLASCRRRNCFVWMCAFEYEFTQKTTVATLKLKE